MGWVVLMAGLALMFVINKKVNPKGKGQNAVSISVMVVGAIAGCGLAMTLLGEWLAAAISGIGDLLAAAIGQTWITLGVTIAATIVVVGFAVADILWDKKADKGAQWCAVLFPTLLALVIGGSFGQSGGEAVRTVNTEVGTFVTTNFGGP